MRSSTSRPPAKNDKPESAWSLARFFIALVVFTWILRSLVFQPFSIPSGSMLPALYIGDYLVVAKWPYGYSRFSFPFGLPSFDGRLVANVPKRGDVVVFRVPAENADLIKRVIGIPGDTVEMRGGRLILNGALVPIRKLAPVEIPITANSPCKVVPPALPVITRNARHPSCVYQASLETLPGGPSYRVLNQVAHGPADDFGPVRVPEGHLFMMGDNRDDSLDSRFPPYVGGIGMIPLEDLIGRAMITFWSTDGSASYWLPWTWFSALRVDRIGNRYTGETE